jgi:hypothetical protein
VIDGYAGTAYYADHLAAVFSELPPEVRGSMTTRPPAMSSRAQALGFTPGGPDDSDNPILVAGFGDLRRAQMAGRTRIAIMEHGAGQSYGGRAHANRAGSYAGGQNRGGASLFLHPGPHPAARDRAAYPKARVEVVGSPHLDTLPKREGEPGRVVAFSTHFNGPLVPETRSAWPWIFGAVARLRDRFEVLGHAHPRMFDKARRIYKTLGIEAVQEFTDVCRRADVYVCDNSSTLFAFAATGRPVVVVNPPYYDRRVNHGLRFWEAAGVGVNCNDPKTLGDCIEEALADPPEQKAKREAALDLVYAYRTGAGTRAAAALMDWAA